MKAVEAAGYGNQACPLRLEHLPDGLVLELGMFVRLGVRHAAVEKPGVQFVKAFDPHSWREEAFADQAHLVLDLPLLPARRRRAGGRLHQVMAAHLQKAPVELALLAKEHRLHRRLHVVVDAARAGALEEREGAGMGVEHHLLAFARIDPHKRHPAMAQTHMRGLHHHRDAVHHNGLVAPVELVGFAGRKAQRNISLRRLEAAPRAFRQLLA